MVLQDQANPAAEAPHAERRRDAGARDDEPKRVRQTTLEVFEPTWTASHTAGIQHLQQMAGGRLWTPRKVEDWMPMPVINEIQGKVQRIVDFFTRKRPTGYVEPNKQTEVDQNAADFGDALLRQLWLAGDEDEKMDELATWLVTTGNCFKKHMIDTTIMQAARVPKLAVQDEPVLNVAGQPIISQATGCP